VDEAFGAMALEQLIEGVEALGDVSELGSRAGELA
jgi:hypothetical protein